MDLAPNEAFHRSRATYVATRVYQEQYHELRGESGVLSLISSEYTVATLSCTLPGRLCSSLVTRRHLELVPPCGKKE